MLDHDCSCLGPELLKSPLSSANDTKMGHIHSVETCGTVDGPGLRYVLFLSGCPLRCLYCHNPDAQGKPSGTLASAKSVIDDVLKYRSFLRNGGLTISGGEPLLQADFVQAVFELAKANGIHTVLDTSGYLGRKATDQLLDLTDLVLLDIKGGDPETYQKTTGVALRPTLDFASRLDQIGKPTWIRFVLVPGLTDDESNVRSVARFAADLSNVERVEVLPFHKMGESKYDSLGLSYELSETAPPNSQQIEACRQMFSDHGIETH